jgi:hypothetical protein
LKSGGAVKPSKLKPKKTRSLFDEPEEEQGSLFQAFIGEETGTSLVGRIFRADYAEMKAVKAKRDAAMAELERAKVSPEEKRFGQKVIAYFTGERDLWAARVNQVMGRLRTLVPDSTEQEGLSLMRDFKGREQELTQFLGGTHPALFELDKDQPLLRGTPGSRYEAAMEQIEKLRPAILKALNPTPRMLDADQALTRISAGTLAEGQRLKFLDSRWTPEQYNPHILHPQGEGEYATPIRNWRGRAIGGKMGKYFGFAEKREFPTLLHAVAEGYRPKTLNAFDAFTIHGDRFATARASHLLENQLIETGVGRYSVKARAPKGWEALAEHSNEFQKLVPFLRETRSAIAPPGAPGSPDQVAMAKINGMRAGENYGDLPGAGELQGEPSTLTPDVAVQHLFVPKFVYDALRPITDPDYMGRVPLFSKIRQLQSMQKAIQLGLSMFHATSENYMALSNMGPGGWLKALRADRLDPEFEMAERDFIAHGGTTGIQGKTVEAYKALQPGSIPSWTDIWRKAPVIHQLDQAAGKITDFTFGNLQRKFKVTDYALHKAAWMADHPTTTAAETIAAKASIAKEINAVYGGLNTELLGINRATAEMARAVLLAPDWTFSNVFNVKYAAERGGTPAGKMARMFWARQLVGGVAATELLSLAMSHQLSSNPTQVYFGKDDSGEGIYQNVFFKGASGDVINLVHNMWDYGGVEGLARTIGGKTAGIPRAGIQFLTNRDYLGHEIVPRGMNPIAATVRGIYKLGETTAPIPFSMSNLGNMLLGPDADKYSAAEVATTLFSGNPPRHVAPDGFRMTRRGLEAEDETPQQSILDEILTGKR